MANEKITGKGYKVELAPIGTQDYVEICATSVGEALNEAVDTYFKLCKAGLASNAVVSIDPQWDLTVKAERGDAGLSLVIGKRLSTDRGVAVRITDNLSNERITFDGELVSIGSTREIGTVVEVAIGIKLADGTVAIENAEIETLEITTRTINDGQENVPVNQDFKYIFDKELDTATITSANILVVEAGTGVVDASISYDKAEKEITIAPTNDLSNNQEFTIIITTDVKGLFGATLPQKDEVNFTTVA